VSCSDRDGISTVGDDGSCAAAAAAAAETQDAPQTLHSNQRAKRKVINQPLRGATVRLMNGSPQSRGRSLTTSNALEMEQARHPAK